MKIVTNCDVAKIHQCYYDEWYFHPTKHIQELNSFKEHTQLETQKWLLTTSEFELYIMTQTWYIYTKIKELYYLGNFIHGCS